MVFIFLAQVIWKCYFLAFTHKGQPNELVRAGPVVPNYPGKTEVQDFALLHGPLNISCPEIDCRHCASAQLYLWLSPSCHPLDLAPMLMIDVLHRIL